MAYYRICPKCGANLNPGEICDCEEEDDLKGDYVTITPKGFAWIALRNAGLVNSLSDPKFESFWNGFTVALTHNGYRIVGLSEGKRKDA